MLHSEPSFSVYADEDGLLDNEKRDLKAKKGSGDFSFAAENDEDDDRPSGFQKLGIVEEPVTGFNGGGDVEEDYKRKVDEEPSNPVFLMNYAHLLQSNGDLKGAEEYYFRATMADPKNGEILMQYAKLVWELHRDQDRALSYFEKAACAAPQDSNVLAAYASFLWEIDDDEENDEESLEVDEGLLEEDYKKMVIENPSDPLHLGNYAHFLQQSKGDLDGAELYYLRAVQAGPGDGEVIKQYAQFVWEVHHDQDKASGYFEQAVKAAPANSGVLAAYAKFLWEAEDEVKLPVFEEAATSA